MSKHRTKRNWSLYNQKLKKIARIEFYISEEALKNWAYTGKRTPGGKKLYSDHVIEMCLLMREFYGLPYRQTQGFVSSILSAMSIEVNIPDYTTLSRRAGKLNVNIRNKNLCKKDGSLVVAVDSTGLSLYSASEWCRKKHNQKTPGHEKWRKLHVGIDIATGAILEARYTKSTSNDGPELPGILESIDDDVSAVCGDMAYDTINCRKAILQKKARALIPPIRNARLSKDNRNISKADKAILKERDDAINYIQSNTINGDQSMARASWKKLSGYHARSLVETTMFQIKSHCSDRLTNKKEDTRATQALIKCKIINKIIAA